MEDFDLNKSFEELLKRTDPSKPAALVENTAEAPISVLPTDPPEEAAQVENITEAPNPISLESILPRLPPEGVAWLNGLNAFCRWAVEHDLRQMPDWFVGHWESVRDTLQRLERELGPSDNWK
jgi:hypothetical protein